MTTAGEDIGEDQFLGMFRDCGTAFRLEWQPYPVDDEEAAFTCWQAGNPLLPSQWPMWAGWLEFTRSLGGKITRVRLLEDPPTPYQQWGMWATSYHRDAGDDIRYIARNLAEVLGIPPANWWLFEHAEDARLVTMNGIAKTLVTDTTTVEVHRTWRSRALDHAAEHAAT